MCGQLESKWGGEGQERVEVSARKTCYVCILQCREVASLRLLALPLQGNMRCKLCLSILWNPICWQKTQKYRNLTRAASPGSPPLFLFLGATPPAGCRVGLRHTPTPSFYPNSKRRRQAPPSSPPPEPSAHPSVPGTDLFPVNPVRPQGSWRVKKGPEKSPGS